MKYFFLIIILFIFNKSNADILQPSPLYEPEEVISIQLSALKINDQPYPNAGIEQTWEFAHPSNKKFTGPLSNFTNMIYSKYYSIMLNHINHKIIFIKKNDNTAYYFVEIVDNIGNKYGFQWTVQKILSNGEYKNCWMTIGVSQPMLIAKSS